MKAIYKYTLDRDGRVNNTWRVQMPYGAELLSTAVQVQKSVKEIVVYAVVNPDEHREEWFVITSLETGRKFTEEAEKLLGKFLGTMNISDRDGMYHIFGRRVIYGEE